MANSRKSETQKQPVAFPQKRLTLGASKRLEAHALAVELLSQCQTDHTVLQALKKQYGVKHSTARSMLRRAEKAMAEDISADLLRRRAVMRKRLEGLYRKAMSANKLTVCANVLRQLSELDSLNEPIKVDVNHQVEFGAGRSVEDLNFYAEHGAWPEEMGRDVIETTATPAKEDPLAALPPVVH
jgi:hypothetical protein